MIQSMTGYGKSVLQLPTKKVTIEIKSLNSKTLDLNVRIPSYYKEKEKIKIHLIDICKSIPALTIFLLPGGTLLLPILIKLIPDILPSAFRDQNDNQRLSAPK